MMLLPEWAGSPPIWSCSVWGLPCPPHCCGGGALLPHLFTLTPPILARVPAIEMLLPEWAGRYVFCGTFRRTGLNPASRTLSGTLLCGVRTFLPAHSRKSHMRRALARMGGATVRSSCQQDHYIWADFRVTTSEFERSSVLRQGLKFRRAFNERSMG
jgi:hypothetical protein